MKNLFLILAFIAPVATFAQDTLQHVVLSPDKYKERISAGVQLVDVRTPEEFAEGHIEDARNIDFFASDFLVQFDRYDKKKPLYIYCRSGNRSAKAAKLLQKEGFSILLLILIVLSPRSRLWMFWEKFLWHRTRTGTSV